MLAQRHRKAEETHEEPRHPTQPGRLDAVGQMSDSTFAVIVQSWKVEFLQLPGTRELWANCDSEAGGVMFLSEQSST